MIFRLFNLITNLGTYFSAKNISHNHTVGATFSSYSLRKMLSEGVLWCVLRDEKERSRKESLGGGERKSDLVEKHNRMAEKQIWHASV